MEKGNRPEPLTMERDQVPALEPSAPSMAVRQMRRRSTGLFSKMKSFSLSFEEQIFEELSPDGENVKVADFVEKMATLGLDEQDPRLKRSFNHLGVDTGKSKDRNISRERFKNSIRDNIVFLNQALTSLVISDFKDFTDKLRDIYEVCKTNMDGQAHKEYTKPNHVNEDMWAVSICSIDGQRHSMGDTNHPFSLSAIQKPLTYAVALNVSGQEFVHKFVGQEPSGETCNTIKLNNQDQPHNPMMNSGAIVTTSLIKRDAPLADRFSYVTEQFKKIAGGNKLTFNRHIYEHLKATSYRENALAYYMLENECFPECASMKETLDLYFQLNSLEMTCETGSIIAATLANGGICPLTGEDVLCGESIRNTLSLMHSCGMYDSSGQFAFKVGLPVKSSKAGVILVIVPNLFGMCLWSPRVDKFGNSVRGIQFCEEMVDRLNLHHYTLRKPGIQQFTRQISKVASATSQMQSVMNLLFAASVGNIEAIKRMYLSGVDVTCNDYDGRTALHLAAAEGHMTCVRFLIGVCKVPIEPRDRWGNRPVDDAAMFKHTDVVNFLRKSSHNAAQMTD